MAPCPVRDTRPASRTHPGEYPARLPWASWKRTEVNVGTATGAQLLVRMLKAEGVRHLFTLSGLHIAPTYAACVEEGIAIVDTRHEQAAPHAADAYARLTRGVGVVAVTAGAGVTDAATGVASAYAASSPGLVLGGAGPTFHA